MALALADQAGYLQERMFCNFTMRKILGTQAKKLGGGLPSSNVRATPARRRTTRSRTNRAEQRRAN